MRLTSNNAPEVRDLIATVMGSMINGATRFRHFDRLHGDAASAELFGVGRFMSCDSVRRNFTSMPKRKKEPPKRKFTQLGILGLELVEATGEDYADGRNRHGARRTRTPPRGVALPQDEISPRNNLETRRATRRDPFGNCGPPQVCFGGLWRGEKRIRFRFLPIACLSRSTFPCEARAAGDTYPFVTR